MTPATNQPAAPSPMTRAEALKNLGLYAKHDKVSGVLVFLLLVGVVVSLFYGHHVMRAILLALAAIVVLLQWAVVLLYRVATFVLDLHGDIALMPETAARIAVAYMKGQTPPSTTPSRR